MNAWYITQKDLLLLSKDKRAVVVLLVLPLLFITIVGMSTGQFLTRDDNQNRFKVNVVDLDSSETSSKLIQSLSDHKEILVIQHPTSESARSSLLRGEASVLVTIGKNFDERVEDLRISDVFNTDEPPLSNGPAAFDLNVEQRPTSIGLGRLLEGIIVTKAMKVALPVAASKHAVTRTWLKKNPKDSEPPEDKPTREALSQTTNSVSTSPARSAAPYLWIVPGFTVMFAFFLVSVMARSFIAERENGTLLRLKLAPIGTTSILLGKTAPFFLTSVIQCFLLFLGGRLLFGMSWGTNPLLLVPVILCTSLAATSLGLLLATIVQTDQQVSSIGTTLILVLSSLSGCFFPREMFPPLMKRISLFTPHGWALRTFDSVLTQPEVPITSVLSGCGMLLLFSFCCFCVGWIRFRSAT